MKLSNKIKNNGFILLLPVVILNIVFIDKLPQAFSVSFFNKGIPFYILLGENIFRIIIFGMPFFLTIKYNFRGFFIFLTGILAYFSSWFILIYAPESKWSTCIYGLMAPAYTPIIWLIGFSLLVDSSFKNWIYSKWNYIIPSILFSIFHILHSYLIFENIS